MGAMLLSNWLLHAIKLKERQHLFSATIFAVWLNLLTKT
jgi:HJR/Mrr/RecB family endonuclease